jgi:DNA (cytosine-5)-methyltransferase 1
VKRKKIFIDLYCGAGGTTTGAVHAAEELDIELDCTAVNHNIFAISTHSINHPGTQHFCQSVQDVEPRVTVPGGYADFLWASLECTHHSNARGGQPMNDQSRSSAWDLLRWAKDLDIETIMIENVREFLDWGPLYPNDYSVVKLRNRPIPERKREFYCDFLQKLGELGYTVESRILNAADYGDPTSRRRLFVQCQKRRPIVWPEATHGTADRPYRTAREIIDWTQKGNSIFGRKKPLAENTMRRILAGLEKFNGNTLEPWLVVLRNHMDSRSLDRPVPTLCGSGEHMGLAEPFLVKYYGGHTVETVDAPLPTITANYEHYALCEPFLVGVGGPSGSAHPQSVDQPIGTVMGVNHRAVCQPFLVPNFGEREGQAPRTHSVDAPLPTVTGHGAGALIQPYLVEYHGGLDGDKRTRSLDEPMPTIDCSNRFGLAEPFITPYYGKSTAVSVDDPLDTVTTKDTFGLCQPEISRDKGELYLDIRFRMLTASELAAAMSFPSGYQFHGGRERAVKQIGNAVPVMLSKSLCKAILGDAI